MCTIVYINRDGVCWRLDWRRRHSKRVKRLAIGKLLASDGDVVDALVDDFCLGGWEKNISPKSWDSKMISELESWA